MQQRVLKITKQRGALDYDQVNNTVNMWLQTCGNGQYLLTMKRVSQPRTDPQNRLMWLWFTAIAQAWSEACGYGITPQDVHDAYCMLFLPKDTPKGRIAGSTKALDTEQMTDFLNKVQADAAAEYGITLPNPEDRYFEVWAEQYNQ